jgi:hypothetical protein
MQAFIYGFPYIHNAKLRHDWVANKHHPDVVPYAAVGHFWHAARLIDASYRDGGCPEQRHAVLAGLAEPQRGTALPILTAMTFGASDAYLIFRSLKSGQAAAIDSADPQRDPGQ